MNLVFSLILLVFPLQAETGHLTIYQDGRKLGTEDFTIVPRRGGYLVEGHTVINAVDRSIDLRSRLELSEDLRATAYQFESKGSTIRLKVDSPVSELEVNVQGQKQNEDIRFPADAMVVDTNFFHHYALLLYRMGSRSGASSFPVFVPQQLEMGQMTISNMGSNTYELDSGNVKVKATTDKDGRLLRLEVPGARVVVER